MKNILKFIKKHAQVFILFLVAAFPLALSAVFISVGHIGEDGKISLTGEVPVGASEATQEMVESIDEYAKITAATLSEKALVTINGTEELLDVPTIETVDAGKSTECPEDTECGQGWAVSTKSPAEFKNATNGQCINVDGAYGSQCWDLGALFWQNYAGRTLNTCGTGAAKGTIKDGCWQENAGTQFEMIWDKTKLQAGDWVIFSSGTWGHVGMALGGYNNGYVALYGTNQGGASCPGGGSTANTINKSLGDFAGAFRPKTYIASKPTTPPTTPTSPTAPTATSDTYVVKRGDTLGGISLYMGWWPSVNGLYGDSGYAQRLANYNGITNRGLIYPSQTIKRAE